MAALADAFLAVRPDEPLAPDLVEAQLAQAVASARAAWPSVTLAPERFAAFLARLGACSTLEGRHLDDLYVACACADGSSQAIAALQQRVTPSLARSLRRLGAAEELLSSLWERLFTGAAPRIATFTGVGPLEGWLRVSLTRAAIDARRVKPREVALEEGELEELASADLELSFIEHQYRDAFKAAFLAALKALESEERNLLRLHYRDGLTVDQLGALLGVHRATAARRLARCREQVLGHTRASLGAHLRVSTETAESLVRDLGAHLELSLSQALATPSP